MTNSAIEQFCKAIGLDPRHVVHLEITPTPTGDLVANVRLRIPSHTLENVEEIAH
jgi:hypothetical protein